MRPVRFVERTMSFPSGDHAAEETWRVKMRSSKGMGLASALSADLIERGSVTISCWASAEAPRTKAMSVAGSRIFKLPYPVLRDREASTDRDTNVATIQGILIQSLHNAPHRCLGPAPPCPPRVAPRGKSEN